MIDYQIRISNRAKRMSIVVHWNGKCEVVLPAKRVPSERQISKFLKKQESWVIKHVEKMKKNADKTPLSHRGISKDKVTQQTSAFVEFTIDRYINSHGFTVNKLIFKNYKTRWGSCSKDNHISFHYKLSLLPDILAEYIVVHELCHTIHFNHSKQFWTLVEVHCPEYKAYKKALKKYLL